MFAPISLLPAHAVFRFCPHGDAKTHTYEKARKRKRAGERMREERGERGKDYTDVAARARARGDKIIFYREARFARGIYRRASA